MNRTKRLLMSEDGQIGSSDPGHAPYRGSDTWYTAGWHEMTLNERADFAAELGRAPTCETCDAIDPRARS